LEFTVHFRSSSLSNSLILQYLNNHSDHFGETNNIAKEDEDSIYASVKVNKSPNSKAFQQKKEAFTEYQLPSPTPSPPTTILPSNSSSSNHRKEKNEKVSYY